MAETKTLYEIIRDDFRAAGGKGRVTKEYVLKWAAENPAYCKPRSGGLWPLWCRFSSGSACPMAGPTPLDRVTDAWLAAGHPAPGKPGFTWEAFQAFAEGYTDEYLELEGDGGRQSIGLTSSGQGIYAGGRSASNSTS